MTESAHAVFLSYASQDAEAARKICEALRAAGVEVWFDQSELRGGDAWDQSIRKQIKTCALFIPVISLHTHERREGYFRLEWNLALDRSRLISTTQTFFVPVVIDNTREDDEEVPEKIRDIHWTRLPGGVTSAAFVERVQRLLSGEPSSAISAGAGAAGAIAGRSLVSGGGRRVAIALALVVFGAIAYFTVQRLWLSKAPAVASPAVSAASTAFTPPPHSVAVLPFVNMSGDKEQDYFSDGLTEELLNSLAEINDLQVAARTSAFSFKGTNTDIGTIARKLNVSAVLEGSVRRSRNTIRITAQLINSVTGFHLWSKSYDRDLGDMLKLQTDIATSVAGALKVTLLGDIAQKIELGGTRNPAAFDAYLRGAKAFSSRRETEDLSAAIAAYTEAIELDPHYALAFAGRSTAFTLVAGSAETAAAVREALDKAVADARQALALAPDLAQAHIALGIVSSFALDFTQANKEYEQALELAPGDAEVLRRTSEFAAYAGRFDASLAAARRASVLDPLARQSHSLLGRVLYLARRYEEAVPAVSAAISLAPDYNVSYAIRGLAYYGLGDLERARASCETKPDFWLGQQCLAVIYGRLGRHADAEALLAKMKAVNGDTAAYQYATIYAQWGDHAKALEWLEMSLRVRDPGLVQLKTDPLLDPLRKEPRFKAMERELKFPN